MKCPKCREEMEQIEAEPDVGIEGGFQWHTCKEWYPDHDYDYSPEVSL